MSVPLHFTTPFFDLAVWCVDRHIRPQDAAEALHAAIMHEALLKANGNKSRAARLIHEHRNSVTRAARKMRKGRTA